METFVKPTLKAEKFINSLSSDKILVQSIHTGEVKSIPRPQIEVNTDLRVSNLLARDDRIVPKQNYSKADAQIINVNAHKGPDEPAIGGI